LRELVGNILIWLVVVPVVAFVDRPHSSYVRLTLFSGFILLPVVLLGGYLSGRWKWNDFEKKYPE
jgi:hypothetical protein